MKKRMALLLVLVMALLALCITLLNRFGNPTKKNAKG